MNTAHWNRTSEWVKLQGKYMHRHPSVVIPSPVADFVLEGAEVKKQKWRKLHQDLNA